MSGFAESFIIRRVQVAVISVQTQTGDVNAVVRHIYIYMYIFFISRDVVLFCRVFPHGEQGWANLYTFDVVDGVLPGCSIRRAGMGKPVHL